jgi:general stress protein YciG
MEQEKTRTSGFGSMNSEKQREIARKGGMAAHRKGTAHEFTPEEARNAGRKGGERVSANRSHMVEIGRLGGKKSAERRRTSPRAGDQTSPDAAESRHTPAPQHTDEPRHPGDAHHQSPESRPE